MQVGSVWSEVNFPSVLLLSQRSGGLNLLVGGILNGLGKKAIVIPNTMQNVARISISVCKYEMS